MAAGPAFTATPRIGIGQVTVANANRDGTGTLVDILVGVAAGTKVEEVVVEATVGTTAGMVRLFLDDGATVRLFDEIPVSAVGPTASASAFRATRRYDNLVLPSGAWKLRASTHNAEAINVIALGGDL